MLEAVAEGYERRLLDRDQSARAARVAHWRTATDEVLFEQQRVAPAVRPADFARCARAAPSAKGLRWTRGGLAVLQTALEHALVRYSASAARSCVVRQDNENDLVLKSVDLREAAGALADRDLADAKLFLCSHLYSHDEGF